LNDSSSYVNSSKNELDLCMGTNIFDKNTYISTFSETDVTLATG